MLLGMSWRCSELVSWSVADSSMSNENNLLDGVSCSYRNQVNENHRGSLTKYERDQKSTHFHRSSTSGLKAEEGSLEDVITDEEGASYGSVASAENLGVRFFVCIINGMFLVGERVGDNLITPWFIWMTR